MTGFLLYNKFDIFRSEEHRARQLCFFIAIKLQEPVSLWIKMGFVLILQHKREEADSSFATQKKKAFQIYSRN